MIENSWIYGLIALTLGAITALAYQSLLWISVKKFTKGKQPIILVVLGFFFRLAMLGICLVFMAKWFQLLGVLSYLAGFFIVKKIAQRRKMYGYHH